MKAYTAFLNFAYCAAGIALFATGEAPVITPTTDFLGDKFSMAWAGWKFSGCLFVALVNIGLPLNICNALPAVLYLAVDWFAANGDPAHWTSLAYLFLLTDGIVLLLGATNSKHGPMVTAVINFAYVAAGIALFATGEAPVITPTTNFLGDKFAMAWAGWKFAGCLYTALINVGLQISSADLIVGVLYCCVDYFAAFTDQAHWTPLAQAFLLTDGLATVLGVVGGDAGPTPAALHRESLASKAKAGGKKVA